MKCPDCNKFAAYAEPEVETDSVSVDDDGSVTVEGTMTLQSECCGADLKSWSFTLNGQVDGHEHPTSPMPVEFSDVDGDADIEASDYYDNPGRPSRYRRHIYVAEATVKVVCACGFETTVTMRDEEGASGFDELV